MRREEFRDEKRGEIGDEKRTERRGERREEGREDAVLQQQCPESRSNDIQHGLPIMGPLEAIKLMPPTQSFSCTTPGCSLSLAATCALDNKQDTHELINK